MSLGQGQVKTQGRSVREDTMNDRLIDRPINSICSSSIKRTGEISIWKSLYSTCQIYLLQVLVETDHLAASSEGEVRGGGFVDGGRPQHRELHVSSRA
jgi:hypothetical protein